jgi:hypothetical protein
MEFSIEYLDPNALLPHPSNWRQHPEVQAHALGGSMKEFGWIQPVLWNRQTGRLIDGHLRVEHARREGLREVPAHVVNVDERTERRMLAALDRVGELRERDEAALYTLLTECLKEDPVLPPGWSDIDYGELLQAFGTDGGLIEGADPDAIPEAVEPRCKSGDLFALGRHRLFCGDSTDQQAVRALVGSARPSLGFADPPYGAKVDEWDETFVWDHDYLAEACEIVAVTPGISSIQRLMQRTQMPYHWSLCAYFPNGCARGALGFCKWMYTALFSTGSIYQQMPDAVKIDLVVGDTDRIDHKGQKPPQFMVWLFELLTQPGDCVLDVFAGSGTSYVAAEQTGRTCMGVEINPAFCDVTIARYEAATGKEAVRL